MRLVAVPAALACVVLLAACGPAEQPPSTAAAPVTTSAPAPAPVPAPLPDPSPPPDPATAAVPAGGGSWTMPDLVGVTLQDAQDAIQALTDFAIPITTSTDATGAGRVQVMDRNWQVCDQNVPAGAEITPLSRIDFDVVKLDERC